MALSPQQIAGGRRQPVNFHPLSPTSFLKRAASISPETPAIVHVDRQGQRVQWSYQSMSDAVMGLAYYLKAKNLRRVGIFAPNTPAFLISVYGIGAAGGVNVAVNYRLSPTDVAYIFAHAEVEAIIADQEFVHLLDIFRRDHPGALVITDDDVTESNCSFNQAIEKGLQQNVLEGAKGWEGLLLHPENELDVIALAYTSGTTARPKGVEYLHRGAYLASLANAAEYGLANIQNECRYLWTLPMFHALGWCCVWAVTAVRGTHYCLRKIDYPRIWALLREERITHFCAAPTVNTLLCSSPEARTLANPVNVIVAASPPTPTLFKQLKAFNLHPTHVYGMTETYGPVTKCYPSPAWDQLSSTDKFERMARQGHELLTSLPARVIRQPNTSDDHNASLILENVRRDGTEIGEVVFTGNVCANGYYKDAEGTKRLFEGGVLHSGDLAVWHSDGAIQIVDRSKDIIISGGENISSVALESILAGHPDILEVAVVAVKDQQWGERPVAYITVKPERPVLARDIVEWAKQAPGMSRFMVPRDVIILGALPKTETGKIQKHILLLAGGYVLWKFVQISRNPLNAIPGPWYAKFTSIPGTIATLSRQQVQYYHDLHQRHGPFVRTGPNQVLVNDIDAFKTIHKIGGHFDKADYYHYFGVTEAGKPPYGLFQMTDRSDHARRRKLLGKGFTVASLRTEWEPMVSEKVAATIDGMRGDAKLFSGEVDVRKWWVLMASDVISKMMFGESFDALKTGQEDPWLEEVNCANQGAFSALMFPWLHAILKRFPVVGRAHLFHAHKALLGKGQAALDNSRDAANLDAANIFSKIRNEADKDEAQLTGLEMSVEAGSFMIAGTDTTSNTLTYLLWAVLSQPELQRTLEKEVGEIEEPLTDTTLERLALLNAVIQETLRLYGAAPGPLPRVVPSGGVELGGYHLPGGVTVATQAYTSHRDPRFFDSPETFDPTRWLTPGERANSETAKAAFAPFGAGSRVCIGKALAYMELRYGAAMFFRVFRGCHLAPSATPESMEMDNLVLIEPRGKVLKVVLPRSSI
ncbi:hypothetical protein PFICI_14936 [Pestalotiopsis fici W106-1]|uniref:AMP-dependent synthetase/ligase domain-containing protein n=1 Tax=Pestalotiopsis fici (strain W106-1 / CGMCC3.15140) TaxID=1229662 RepID=W3WKJ2_PESFW|nr:uncharacterized protein PFICI_14936 [Pestalotiopsis fici W106-1]ETS73331.1 hypothetical protein PFICI_14936 [Pestalotiopsis fici W106-1]